MLTASPWSSSSWPGGWGPWRCSWGRRRGFQAYACRSRFRRTPKQLSRCRSRAEVNWNEFNLLCFLFGTLLSFLFLWQGSSLSYICSKSRNWKTKPYDKKVLFVENKRTKISNCWTFMIKKQTILCSKFCWTLRVWRLNPRQSSRQYGAKN